MLSDSDSDVDDVHQLTVNEHFAKAYERKKEREELSKLKEKYGSDGEGGVGDSDDNEDDSEEDTTEDDEGVELTPAVDAAILRTLARIKRRDPGIYESGKEVFEEEQTKTKVVSAYIGARSDKAKSKPLLMRQHVLNSALATTSRSPSPAPLTHAEEQAALRAETIDAFKAAVPGAPDAKAVKDEDEEEDDFLVPREKTKDEIEQEQEEYSEFLRREVGEDIGNLVKLDDQGEGSDSAQEEEAAVPKEGEGEVADREKRKKRKRRKEKKSKEEADHEFLMNYILNRGWIDHSSRHVPTYHEVTASTSTSKSEGKKKGKTSAIDVIGVTDGEDDKSNGFDEEEFEEIADTFESSYNFRFEEPGAASIPSHPRAIASTVRREENPRKDARERKKERKEERLLQKKEEVKRMKALKMKEIREKLVRIGKEGGRSADDEALAKLDLEGDWDPDAHDQQMLGIYGEDDAPEGVVEKPIWDDDIDIGDIAPEAGPSASSKSKSKKDKKRKKKDEDLYEDGVDVDVMDADALNDVNFSEDENEEETPLNNAARKRELDQYMDDVYALDFSSLVGDLPTRFKYTPVLPTTYGLSPAEILLADDAELNSYVGLRALAPYRRDKGKLWDTKRGEKLQELRKSLKEKKGYVAGGERGTDGERPAKKRRGKKERQKEKHVAAEILASDEAAGSGQGGAAIQGGKSDSEVEGEVEGTSAKKQKRRHKKPL